MFIRTIKVLINMSEFKKFIKSIQVFANIIYINLNNVYADSCLLAEITQILAHSDVCFWLG